MWLRKASILCTTLPSLAVLSGAGMAHAANACANAETNLAMKECLGKAYLRVDKERNFVWKQVLRSVSDADYLTPEQRSAWKKELRAAQRAWVQFKERDCNGAVGYELWGGSGAGAAIKLSAEQDRGADQAPYAALSGPLASRHGALIYWAPVLRFAHEGCDSHCRH